MNKKLDYLLGKRCTFLATYSGVRLKETGYSHKNGKIIPHFAPVMELSHVLYCDNNHSLRLFADNFSINYTTQFARLGQLISGEVISFNARVSVHDNSKLFEQPRIEYRLLYPSSIAIKCSLVDQNRRYPMPTERNELIGFVMETNTDDYLAGGTFYKQGYVDKYDAWCDKQVKKRSAADQSNAKRLTTSNN